MLPTAPCKVCPTNDRMARIRGCDGKSASSPVEYDQDGDIIYVYWNCPNKFIPLSIYKWFNEYEYQHKFPSAPMPSYENISRRFITACNVYEQTKAMYQEKIDKTK